MTTPDPRDEAPRWHFAEGVGLFTPQGQCWTNLAGTTFEERTQLVRTLNAGERGLQLALDTLETVAWESAGKQDTIEALQERVAALEDDLRRYDVDTQVEADFQAMLGERIKVLETALRRLLGVSVGGWWEGHEAERAEAKEQAARALAGTGEGATG